jgi:hypothetical protein
LSGGSSSLVCALGDWSMTCRRRRPLLRRRSLPYRVCVEGAVADGWRPFSRVVRGDSDGRRGLARPRVQSFHRLALRCSTLGMRVVSDSSVRLNG